MGQPLSGKAGELLIGASNLLQLTQWQLEYGAAVQVYAARSGGGAEETVAGTEGGTGTFRTPVRCRPADHKPRRDRRSGLARFAATPRPGPFRRSESCGWVGSTFAPTGTAPFNALTVAFTCHGKWTFPT